jgi:Family of unknown function (DUF6220)
MPIEHATFIDLADGTPVWFTTSARLLPAGLLGQFGLAGAALYGNEVTWQAHAALGLALLLPVATLLVGALTIRRLRGFGWWTGVVAALYVVQIALAAGPTPPLLALHPLNGALLLCATLILVAKIERRRGRSFKTELSHEK